MDNAPRDQIAPWKTRMAIVHQSRYTPEKLVTITDKLIENFELTPETLDFVKRMREMGLSKCNNAGGNAGGSGDDSGDEGNTAQGISIPRLNQARLGTDLELLQRSYLMNLGI